MDTRPTSDVAWWVGAGSNKYFAIVFRFRPELANFQRKNKLNLILFPFVVWDFRFKHLNTFHTHIESFCSFLANFLMGPLCMHVWLSKVQKLQSFSLKLSPWFSIGHEKKAEWLSDMCQARTEICGLNHTVLQTYVPTFCWVRNFQLSFSFPRKQSIPRYWWGQKRNALNQIIDKVT